MNCDVNGYLLATSDDCYDIIVLTETWLDSRTISSQVFGHSYEVFRCDRSPRNSTKTIGGGVIVAVKKTLKAKLIDNDSWASIEQVWVNIELFDRNLFLCGIYIPPDRTRDMALIETHNRSIVHVSEAANPDDELVVVGDFNLPGISWQASGNGFVHPDPVRSSLHFAAYRLLDCYSTATLRQINNVLNENDRCLDLCFVSARDVAPSITLAPTAMVKNVAHHPPLVITLQHNEFRERHSISPVYYDFRNADQQSIVEFLSSIDWLDELDSDDVETAAVTLTHIIEHAIERHVPKKVHTSSGPPWQTRELRHMKTTKRAALRLYTKHRTTALRDHYARVNYQYKTASRHCFKRYQQQIQRNLKSKPKSFWRYVTKQRKQSGLPSVMKLNTEVADNWKDICALFAAKFSSVFCDEELSDEHVAIAASNVPLCGETFSTLTVDDTMITEAAGRLKSSMNPGPDGIPSAFLKTHIDQLLIPLRHVFSLSLRSGRFPTAWKTATMFPVHKKGNRNDVNNYRGISALCSVSKLFELIVMNPTLSHCKQSISGDQHGFISGRSTTTNLLCLTSHIAESFADRVQTDVIYTDLTAAFDKINHSLCVAKLERFGIGGHMLRWFSSYLTDRRMTVELEGFSSGTFTATSGVPQGSHLGPLIFLLYFNDVNAVIKGPRLSFADDLKLFLRIRTIADATALQHDIDAFAAWCDLNRLAVNPDKCNIISFSRKKQPILFGYQLKGKTLLRTDNVKDLGVILDAQLTFRHHLSYVIEKASRTLGFIFRVAKDFTDPYCLKSLYCSLVRATLEYCSAVWHPYYRNGVERIESVQRRFIRYALRRLPWQDPFRLPSYRSRCLLIQLEPLQTRRDVNRAMVVADLLLGRIDCPALLESINVSAHSRTLRNNSMLRPPLQRTNFGQNSAMIGLQRVFNRVAEGFDFHLSRQAIRRNYVDILSRLSM